MLFRTSGSIGFDANSGRSTRSTRNVDQRERRDLLRLAVLEDLEVFGLQVGDELALLIEDARVDFDVVHFRAERDRRLLRRLGLSLRRAA